jgi:hypothetical protein
MTVPRIEAVLPELGCSCATKEGAAANSKNSETMSARNFITISA